MDKQIPLPESARADAIDEHGVEAVRPDVGWQRTMIVNVAWLGDPASGEWVLVDTGVTGAGGALRRAAERRFGDRGRPRAIVMTHGHFDHAANLVALAEEWRVPVYAHELELPYLDGRASYPPADPSVGGGLMARLSPLFPNHPYDARPWLQALPVDGTIPELPGWRWLHTPGHTPGHISLWRESDRVLIAGDAFITTRQESAYAVLTQQPEMHGPPAYFTQHWDDAERSVQRLAALEPEVVITGHGPAMAGDAMRDALHQLAVRFRQVAVPVDGRYVEAPADAASGTAYRMHDGDAAG